MGAYYTPTALINETKHNYQRLGFYSCGAKLMEHSYFGTNLVNGSLFMIESGAWKNKSFTWACDYSEDLIVANKNIYDISQNNTICELDMSKKVDGLYNNVIILNNSKMEYLDLSEYVYNYKFDKKWMIHPFPLLTNSEKDYMGGGACIYEITDRQEDELSLLVSVLENIDLEKEAEDCFLKIENNKEIK